MARYCSDPSREHGTWALPNVEVFYAEENELGENEAGWYYWFCLPGCMPDSDPYGPFDTEEDAVASAQDSE